MTVYRADLTGPHNRLVAHLLPGDAVEAQTSLGKRTIVHEDDWPGWLAVYDDANGLRICRYGSAAQVARHSGLPRQRGPVVEALRAVRAGGAAYIVCEWRQDTNRAGLPFGPLLWLPAGHVQVGTAEHAAAGGTR